MTSMDARDFLVQRATASEVPRIRAGASSYFTKPTPDLDPALFGPDYQLHQHIRAWVLTALRDFWAHHYNLGGRWYTVWLAGSGITYQWSAARDPGDLDVLIGVDFDSFRRLNPYFQGFSDLDIGQMMNETLKAGLWPWTDRTHFPVNSKPWVESPRGMSKQSFGPTNAEPALPHSPESMDALHTPSSTTSSVQGSNFARASVARRARLAAAVSPQQFSSAGYVPSVDPATTESGTSNGSTESLSPSTSGSWVDRRAAALSARDQQRRSVTESSKLTTVTVPGVFEDSSALFATTPSVPSEILTRESRESSTTSNKVSDPVYSVTFFVNPNSADIRFIHPYAAYNVTDDTWTVHPPELGPDWNPEQDMPQDWWAQINREQQHSTALLREYVTTLRTAKQTTNVGNRVNVSNRLAQIVRQGAEMFHDIHESRKLAFGPDGKGYSDYYNFRWQAHKRNGVVPALHSLAELHAQAKDEQHTAVYGQPLVDSDAALRAAATVHAHLDALRV